MYGFSSFGDFVFVAAAQKRLLDCLSLVTSWVSVCGSNGTLKIDRQVLVIVKEGNLLVLEHWPEGESSGLVYILKLTIVLSGDGGWWEPYLCFSSS